ncbi:MAG: trypsin-like peptidase domain-containing protein [Chloroflexi bacterium]|nr:trypsin-like peptidase domain-containing protein [Chloroflexota bacterium]MCI0579846.1 trypsin-like peptidase domain-containing protein [Chloroflexota bacterium]MCI0645671.1 trypsin-like peptidase domain-containing protein [Chloroflexota bacterium]MCI0725583.1 trypsin-like peptidase domain-containing protein [Chloroflexota bacterium]
MMLKKQQNLYFFLIALLLATIACGLTTTNQAETQQIVPTATTGAGQPAVPVNQPVSNNQNALALETALINLYQQTNPSVVHILVYLSAEQPIALGSGSGFVYDTAGRIVTNNHVVTDGEVFEVVFADGNRRRAQVIGTDVDSDLAVIAVDSLPAGVNPLPLGNSDSLQVGQVVVAIGNPFGEQGSMSMGIISGLGRSLESQRGVADPSLRYSLPDVVQTDTPINPGNSGGPLINLQGEVVGVNSAIRSDTGFNSGVGFAIPVNAVRRIVPSLIENGSYVYSYMGVRIQTPNLNTQEELELPQLNGAYLIEVTAGGPAEEAGLIPAGADGLGGDLIVAIDGQPINNTEDLISYLVFNTVVGQTVDVTVVRNGETINVPVTLGARP